MLVLYDSINVIMILWNKRFFRHLHVCLATSIHKKITTATRKKTTEKDTCTLRSYDINPLTPGKLRKNGTFKHEMVLF